MTKHLRLLMLALLAIICTGGVKAQTEQPEVTLNFNDATNPWGFPTGYAKDGKIYTYSNDGYTIQVQVTKDGGCMFMRNSKTSPYVLQCHKSGIGITLPAFNFVVSKIELDIDGPANDLENNIYVGSKAVSSSIKGKQDYIFDINGDYQTLGTLYTIKNAGAASRIIAIKIYKKQDSGKTATTIAFAEGIENSTITVKDGETFGGYKATCTTEGAKGAIQYSSSNTDVATVDEATGAITMGSKYGKTVITAQFIGTDGYANSDKISYTIEYKGDYAFYESFDGCAGKGGNNGVFSDTGTDKAKYDNEGWNGSNEAAADRCIKLGSAKKQGSITSPFIRVSTNSLLTFKAAAWEDDTNKKIKISVDKGTLTYNKISAQQVEITLDDTKWTDYEMIVSGATSFKVTFTAVTDNKNRFFLDEVMVKEIPATDVTLNEDEANVVEASNNANVTLKRTLNESGWNTLCLPFSLTDAQTKAAFGDDVKLRTLASFDGNTLTFTEATGITAGVPCLIKVSEVAKDNTYTFTGVSVKAIKADTDKYDMDESLTFVGIYVPMDVATTFEKDGKAHFLGAGNKFYKAKAGTTMKAFRAFFLVPASTDTQALKAVIDGTTTGIDDLNIDVVKADGRVYNLNGQYVGNSLEGLKAGVYIQNGKKVIKK